MSVARKLQVPAASTVAVLGRPSGVDLEVASDCLVLSDPADAATAPVVISFVVHADDLVDVAGPAIAAAREDRLAWIAYPKSRQLGSDLNRDILVELVRDHGVQPVRAVSIDSVWSALRFRPL